MKYFSLILGFLLLASCGTTKQTETSTNSGVVATANPASEYCISQGGTSSIKKNADGSEYGICTLTDGSEVEEWAFFRAATQSGMTDTMTDAMTGTTYSEDSMTEEETNSRTVTMTSKNTITLANGYILTKGLAGTTEDAKKLLDYEIPTKTFAVWEVNAPYASLNFSDGMGGFGRIVKYENGKFTTIYEGQEIPFPKEECSKYSELPKDFSPMTNCQ